ncbi:MAG: hypothetical protein CL878_09145 [Dehalococcoidia bacterium]|nr:hypothetical protein [Dehalococcoidia bacterium]
MIYRHEYPREFARWFGAWDTTDEDDLRLSLLSIPPTAEDFGVMWYLIRSELEERRTELEEPSPGTAQAAGPAPSPRSFTARQRLLKAKEQLLDQCY